MGCSASIVQRRENARWSLLLNQLANNLVVEVLDWCPLNLLLSIFFLLSLQSQLNENLLKLLIDVVDAKLLERVALEDLKSIDIENTDTMLDSLASFQRDIDALGNLIEQPSVDAHTQRVARGRRLRNVEWDIVC